jgi:monofunctional glycosyltransferase
MNRILSFCKRIVKTAATLLVLLILAILTFIAAFYLFSPNVSSLASSNPTTTAFIELYNQKANKDGLIPSLQWKWVSLEEISPVLISSILHTEDTTFWDHHGFEWSQIKRAFQIIWQQHHIITGGSTITQQVAKNLYLYPDRTLFRKCREFLITHQLEQNLSKERILEIYLNIVEWGDGIFGIEAASQYWFHCSAKELNPHQAVSLAFVLPNPHKRNPTKLSKRLTVYANILLMKLSQEGIISDEEAFDSMMLPDELLTEEILDLSL